MEPAIIQTPEESRLTGFLTVQETQTTTLSDSTTEIQPVEEGVEEVIEPASIQEIEPIELPPDEEPEEAIETRKRIEEVRWVERFPKEFNTWEEEIKFVFQLVMTRGGRFKGQTTVNFLIKDVPPNISTNKLKELFKALPENTEFFEKKSTSIHITEDGKKFAKEHKLV